jgi:hypothetical protein
MAKTTKTVTREMKRGGPTPKGTAKKVTQVKRTAGGGRGVSVSKQTKRAY